MVSTVCSKSVVDRSLAPKHIESTVDVEDKGGPRMALLPLSFFPSFLGAARMWFGNPFISSRHFF
jgi:hypothetical protein